MVRYILQQIKITSHKCFGKWFAKNVVEETIDLDALAEHMSNRKKSRLGALRPAGCNKKSVRPYDGSNLPPFNIFHPFDNAKIHIPNSTQA